MKNIISNSIPALLAMAGQASNGAGEYPALLVINTKANIDADVAALVDSIMEYGNGKTALADHRDELDSLNDVSRKFLMVTRETFKPTFGFEYNVRWDVTGLVGSFAIPNPPPEVLLLLRSFKQVLTEHPDLEIASKNITAAQADELFTQLNAAYNAVQTQQTVVDGLLDARNAKADLVRKRMADLIGELKMRMDGLDNRWGAFGLNRPDALESPDIVEHVQVTLIGPTAAALKWDAAPRAEYYHVFKRVQGVDQDFVLVGSPADLDFTIENLPTNAQIDIVVSALNNGGEGQRSIAVTVTTHA